MQKVEKSIRILAPVQEVFAYLRDPMNNAEWLPGMVEVKQVQLNLRMLRLVASTITSEYVISAQYTMRAKSTAN